MSKPKYWRGLDELEQTPEFLAEAGKEFPTDMPIDQVLSEASEENMSFQANRRDFLKVMGFGMTAAALAACAEGPVKKAIPYVNKPDDIIPGVANWYASTSPQGNAILVKTREGRPIKLEGNPDSPLTRGGLFATDQATVLDMYDDERLRAPMRKGNLVGNFDEVDADITKQLAEIKAKGGTVRVLTHSLLSPSTKQVIGDFMADFEDAKHISYDALSTSALAKAHAIAFGKRAVPQYMFDQAMSIVSFGADFLGTWIAPAAFSSAYAVNRNPDQPMSRHLQFESLMTNTGAKADLRFPLNPSQQGLAILNLYNKVAAKLGKGQIPGVPSYNVYMDGLDIAASDLVKNRGKALVISDSNDVSIQTLVASLNQMLGNYGKTLSIAQPAYYQQGDDEAMVELAKELEQGRVDALFVYGANPVYASPFAAIFERALPKVDLTVSFATKPDETSELCRYVVPDHFFLESWGDAQQTATHYTLMQPTIYPIFRTRQAQDSFLKWSGSSEKYHDYLKRYWEQNMFPQQSEYSSFRVFWNEALRKGIFMTEAAASTEGESTTAFVLADSQISEHADRVKRSSRKELPNGELEVVFYPKVAILDGSQANNPWLQELPDPITRVVWDNYVTVPVSMAKAQNLKNEDLVEVTLGDEKVLMPVYVQPGQAMQTIGLALGYGRKHGKVAQRANGKKKGDRQIGGVNFFPMLAVDGGAMQYSMRGASLSKTGEKYPMALTQTFNTLYDPEKADLLVGAGDYDRSEAIIEETTMAEYTNGTYKKQVSKREAKKDHLVSLWDSHFEDPETARNIHWKMAIDMNKCTGCGACVVACQAENNIPVVGKEEVRTRREMHWMRIDRYYSGETDNPDVAFQPMLCQHCDNAPCETVCPVLATIHSNEGLNQMTYNRCVGTRYCANNCPYKVRRFNWFNYWQDTEKFSDFYTHSELGKLVLNPDVTVRFRGVMEKCSFCVQRLQESKLRAKVNAKSTYAKPEDGEVQVACQQSCPTGAIVFGDFNDPNSAVSKAYRESRSYAVLEEVKTLPSVQYQALVRNRDEKETKMKEAEQMKARPWLNPSHAAEEHAGDHA